MRSDNIFLFVCFVYAAKNVLAQSDDDEWFSVKKKDLCPALHKEAMCTEKIINFDDVAKEIRELGKKDANPLSDDQIDTGEDTSKCGDPLKKAFCSSDASPLCLEDRTSGDDSAEKRACNDLYNNCPLLAGEEGLNYTEECAEYLKRKYSDMTCEAVGSDFDEGGCPKPSKKMPEFYIQIYEAKSKVVEPLKDLLDDGNELIDNVWDQGCLKTVQELPCMPIYCKDDDENTVLIKNKRKDCTRAMECVSKATKKLESLAGDFAKDWVDELRDAVKESCETIIKGFDDLINHTSRVTGGVSTAKCSIHVTLLFAFLCLKILW